MKKRIVKAERITPSLARLMFDDGSTQDAEWTEAAEMLASQAIEDLGGGPAEMPTAKPAPGRRSDPLDAVVMRTFQESRKGPRALRLTRAGDGARCWVRADTIVSVEPTPESDAYDDPAPFAGCSEVVVGFATYVAREPAEAIVAALGWDVVEVQYGQPGVSP